MYGAQHHASTAYRKGLAPLDGSGRTKDSAPAMPHHARYLFVCQNRRAPDHPKGSCAEAGSEALVPALRAAIGKLGGSDTVRVCTSGCLDLCASGASIVQEPEHVAYGRVTEADVPEIAAAAVRGEVALRLVVHPVKASG